MPPWEPAARSRQPTRGTQGRAGCSAGTGVSCPCLRLPLPPLHPWATCPVASELQLLPPLSPPNPYQQQRKLEEIRREIRRCYAAVSLCGPERMQGTALPSSIPGKEVKVLPRHHPALRGTADLAPGRPRPCCSASFSPTQVAFRSSQTSPRC